MNNGFDPDALQARVDELRTQHKIVKTTERQQQEQE